VANALGAAVVGAKQSQRKAGTSDEDRLVGAASSGKKRRDATAATGADLVQSNVGKTRAGKTDTGKISKRRHVGGEDLPVLNLAHPDHVADLVYLVCFRGRKFGRARFARLMQERIGSSDAVELLANVPVELIALFFSRELRRVTDEQAPVNECFEMPDGGMLEFVGDQMDATETIARLLLTHDEQRLNHVVELLAEHDRSWLHTLAVEARDARLIELGFPDLDDVERLFVPWHARLLIRKLQASTMSPTARSVRLSRSKITSEAVLAYIHALQDPDRQLAIERMSFLAMCQAVQDGRMSIERLTPTNMQRSAAAALRVVAVGLREADCDMAVLAGPQVSTIYRLGLTTVGGRVSTLPNDT